MRRIGVNKNRYVECYKQSKIMKTENENDGPDLFERLADNVNWQTKQIEALEKRVDAQAKEIVSLLSMQSFVDRLNQWDFSEAEKEQYRADYKVVAKMTADLLPRLLPGGEYIQL